MDKIAADNSRRLITIPMSHYCEKARWGMERLGLPYYEERHLQLFHYPRTFLVSSGPNVPVLMDAGKVITDSTKILQHLDQYAHSNNRLYPEQSALRKQVETWEDRFDEELGVDSRRWVYFHMLPHPVAALVTAGQGVPAYEKKLAPYGYGFLKWFISKLLSVNPDDVAAGVSRSRALIAETDAMLTDGRRYLLGDCFTAADLTLACMMSPYVLPRNYGIRLPTLDEVPVSMRNDIHYFQATLTGKYVLQLFDTERIRRNSAITNCVQEKGIGSRH